MCNLSFPYVNVQEQSSVNCHLIDGNPATSSDPVEFQLGQHWAIDLTIIATRTAFWFELLHPNYLQAAGVDIDNNRNRVRFSDPVARCDDVIQCKKKMPDRLLLPMTLNAPEVSTT